MQNHREARQANFYYIATLARLYTRWAQSITWSEKYTIDERLEMTRAADNIADGLRDEARNLYP